MTYSPAWLIALPPQFLAWPAGAHLPDGEAAPNGRRPRADDCGAEACTRYAT